LGGVGGGADFEIDVRSGNAHLAKEDVGEFFVVVLAGMNEDRVNIGMALHFAHERRDFGEVGARADNVKDFQSHVHERFAFELVIDNSTAASSFLVGG